MTSNIIEFPMLELKAAWKEASTRLKEHKIAMPLMDARLLLQEALGFSYEDVLANATYKMTQAQVEHYARLISRRLNREPVSVILGRKPFWKHEFITSADTLDPRPDSETLIDVLVKRYAQSAPPKQILELGCGTGCLILSLLAELPEAKGLAVDVSPEALRTTQANAEKLELTERLDILPSDWFEMVEGTYDLIISNPPYIPSEDIKQLEPEVREFDPMGALDGGVDGMDCYHRILAQAGDYLADNGLIALEIGDNQSALVSAIAVEHGFNVMIKEPDLRGTIRCLLLQKS